MATNFSLRDLEGDYYELALHDFTQYPLCPSKPRCISSGKRVRQYPDGVSYVDDKWNLFCLGHYYPQTLLFNETAHAGFLIGYVPAAVVPFLPSGVLANVRFPDTIVDFRPGPSGWALEFQCVEALGGVRFVGINFYAKQKTQAAYEAMIAAAVASGIDFYMVKGRGLTNVSQLDCPTPPNST